MKKSDEEKMEKSLENLMVGVMKISTLIVLPCIIGLGLRLLYEAWFKESRASLFLTIMGLLILSIGVLGFKHRKKIWSLV